VMTVFALAAAALALVGLYALVAYGAKQRTREVGVRLALGATRGDVVKTMMRSAVGLTVAGTCAGLAVAMLAMAGLESMLFGIAPRDPATLTAVPLALVACAALAAYVPARRAARVDPAITLRD
jgi:putative ABC transport system permease protein